MRTFQSMGLFFVAIAGATLSGQALAAGNTCDLVKKCSDGCYTTVYKAQHIPETLSQTNETEGCPENEIEAATNGEYLGFKMPLSSAPVPVAMDCAPDNAGAICEAWPQGDSITYSWSSSGNIVLDAASGTANPVRGFSCTSGTQGTITVTAFSPTGASETLTQTVSCQ
ncbi:MAG TPA: hypothetical protein VJ724_08810 [Tahibacter sp.]|nr:hypothetical protein [Tahibacter sp.]